MGKKEPFFAIAKVSAGRRIHLPAAWSRLIPELRGAGVDVWLTVLQPGRYRVLFKSALNGNEIWEDWQRAVDESTSKSRDPFQVLSSVAALAPARLIPTRFTWKSAPGAGWRLSVPMDLPPRPVRKGEHVYLILCQGFLEFWTTEEVERASSASIIEAFNELRESE